MRRVRLILGLSVVMAAMVVTTALPTAAQGFGPSVSCNAGTLEKCTESAFLGSSRETFDCEGKTRDVISCTNRRTSETSPTACIRATSPAKLVISSSVGQNRAHASIGERRMSI